MEGGLRLMSRLLKIRGDCDLDGHRLSLEFALFTWGMLRVKK